MRNTRHKNTNDSQKKYCLGTDSKNILLDGLNQFHCASQPREILFAVFSCVRTLFTDVCIIQIITILRKTIEGYKNSFDFVTFGNIIFKQIIFVIDRIITMQFTKMQIEIHRSLVTRQYYTKCTDPLYPKFTSKKFSALNFF